MLNPSIGVYHIEGVHPECDTVEKALNWRNQSEGSPVILTYRID
jgi:arsenate reductase-like glutaredoxin family protein